MMTMVAAPRSSRGRQMRQEAIRMLTRGLDIMRAILAVLRIFGLRGRGLGRRFGDNPIRRRLLAGYTIHGEFAIRRGGHDHVGHGIRSEAGADRAAGSLDQSRL